MRCPLWPCSCQLCTVAWPAVPRRPQCLGRHARSLPHGVRPRVSIPATSGRAFYVGLQCSIPRPQDIRPCNCNEWDAATVRSLCPSWQKACPLNARAALISSVARISTSSRNSMQLHIPSQCPAVNTPFKGMCKAILPASTCCSASRRAPGSREWGLLGCPT